MTLPNRPELPADLAWGRPVFDVVLKGSAGTDAALQDLAPGRSLALEDAPFVGGGLHALRDRPLHALRLKSCPLTPGGFRQIGALSGLRTLQLIQCPLPQDWVQVLAGLPLLASLTLTGVQVPERSFRGFERLAALQRLRLHGPSEYAEHPDPVDDEALASIGRSVGLVGLDLWRGKRPTDAGLEALTSLARLRRLSLGDPDHAFSPGDVGVAHLARLGTLEVLELHTCGRNFGVEGLSALESLPGLRWLYLEACHATPALEAGLQARWNSWPPAWPQALGRWWSRE